jgi:hypothetical protein
VQVTRGALKHGVPEPDIRAVVATPLRVVAQGERTLYIGVTDARDLLEVVAEPDGTVVHAMRLRPKHYVHLRPA